MYIIGIDIGATKIIFVLMNGQQVLKTKKILTPKTGDRLVAILKKNIEEMSFGKKIKKIGIGIPGPLNKNRDLILNPPNLKCLWNYPLAKILEKDIGIKTKMDRDVNCFTLGEVVLGVAKEASVVFGITLGSGVGGGIAIKRKIYRGAFGSAGEVGHTIIGDFGCLEEYCSQKFFQRKKYSSIKLQEKAKKGDLKALKIFKEYGKYLGIGLSNVINLLDPEVIVIGGGIAGAYKFFIKETKKEIKKRVISPTSQKYIKVKKAKLGELAGAIGASML